MTPEPLRGKKVTKYATPDEEWFEVESVKSAVEGLIKYHEDIIEDLVKECLEPKAEAFNNSLSPFIFESKLLLLIGLQYEAIQNIEHWMEDAI
jgi:hypothetical protein